MQEKRLACINLKSSQAILLIEKINIKLDSLKAELEKFNLFATQGAIMRSKSAFFELGEKNSKYFFSLEKRNSKAKSMSTVYDDQKRLITKPRQVLDQQVKFYQQLYTNSPKIDF